MYVYTHRYKPSTRCLQPSLSIPPSPNRVDARLKVCAYTHLAHVVSYVRYATIHYSTPVQVNNKTRNRARFLTQTCPPHLFKWKLTNRNEKINSYTLISSFFRPF